MGQPVQESLPALQIRLEHILHSKFFQYDLVKFLLLHHKRHLVYSVRVNGLNDSIGTDIAEQGQFLPEFR